MLFVKPPELSLFVCSRCHGSGSPDIRQCSLCRGMGHGRFVRDRWLYYGEPLSPYHIALRRTERMLDRVLLFFGVICGVGFLGLFVWYLVRTNQVEAIGDAAFWFGQRPLERSFFWLACVSFGYVIYHLVRVKHPLVPIRLPKAKAASFPSPSLDSPQWSWEKIRRLPRGRRIDITQSFTASAREALERAYHIAERQHSETLRPEHLFYALLLSPGVGLVFLRLDISAKMIEARLAKLFSQSQIKQAPLLSPDVEQIIFQAYEAAVIGKRFYVHVTELLLTTVQQSETLQEILYDLKIDKQTLLNVIEWLRIRDRLREQYRTFRRAAAGRSKYGLDRAMTAVATPYLNRFSQDLTLAAKFGYGEPCVARDSEIDEIFRIVEGGRQNVLLVGEMGVGKRSIVEGITECMIEDAVPKRLQDKRLVQLSVSTLLAGTTVSGAQERLIRIMHEIARAKNVILFIHNLHDLMNLGKGDGEGLDVSGTLAEYLRAGRFLTLATTVPEAFNRHIINSQVGGIFARVEVKEMDENQAIQVLEAKVATIEYEQNVFFSYAALEQAVRLARKFIYDQRLPESAIELMTEAAASVRNTRGEQQLVSREDVATIVSQKTGVPVTTISEDESSKLLRLEEAMHTRIVGQHEAVQLVANALRRARAEIRSTSRPIANFLFLGPTGVGKTELAKTIAVVYFGGEKAMIRIDMSEFQDTISVYRLIGQPGQQGTGLLTEAVRQRPFSLILLDELEKADPNVLNLFLQVFDDGRLTDSVGRVIDFTNTIIIATSNAGTRYVQEAMMRGDTIENIRQTLIRTELKQYYRPEFLNRFDGIVLFKPLERQELGQIARLMLQRVAQNLEERGVGFRVEEAAIDRLVEVGYDPEFGARPMRRAIQELVEDKLAELVLGAKLKRRDVVVLAAGALLRIESPVPRV